eukprot:131977-Chlamydomonas_euryale.AAC.3
MHARRRGGGLVEAAFRRARSFNPWWFGGEQLSLAQQPAARARPVLVQFTLARGRRARAPPLALRGRGRGWTKQSAAIAGSTSVAATAALKRQAAAAAAAGAAGGASPIRAARSAPAAALSLRRTCAPALPTLAPRQARGPQRRVQDRGGCGEGGRDRGHHSEETAVKQHPARSRPRTLLATHPLGHLSSSDSGRCRPGHPRIPALADPPRALASADMVIHRFQPYPAVFRPRPVQAWSSTDAGRCRLIMACSRPCASHRGAHLRMVTRPGHLCRPRVSNVTPVGAHQAWPPVPSPLVGRAAPSLPRLKLETRSTDASSSCPPPPAMLSCALTRT